MSIYTIIDIFTEILKILFSRTSVDKKNCWK